MTEKVSDVADAHLHVDYPAISDCTVSPTSLGDVIILKSEKILGAYAIIIRSGSLSGAEKRAINIARAFLNRGQKCTLIMDERTHRALTNQKYDFDWSPVVLYRLPSWLPLLAKGRRRFAKLRRLIRADKLERSVTRMVTRMAWRRLLRAHGVSVAHVFLTPTVLRHLSIPHIFEVTSPDVARVLTSKPHLVSAQTVLHAVSEGVATRLAGHFDRNQIITAPIPFFNPGTPAGANGAIKENLVVYGHRFVDRKNPIAFARAARRFVAMRPDWRVLIRGGGPLDAAIREIVAQEIAEGSIEVGYNANLMQDLRRSRIFVSITEPDNYPSQSVLEAMWCGNAVLLSDRGRTRARFFADNGVLCEPDENSVFEALVTMTADLVMLDHYGANAQRHVEASFSPDVYLDHLETVYRSVYFDT